MSDLMRNKTATVDKLNNYTGAMKMKNLPNFQHAF